MRKHKVTKESFLGGEILDQQGFTRVVDVEIAKTPEGTPVTLPLAFDMEQVGEGTVIGTEVRPVQQVIRRYDIFEPYGPVELYDHTKGNN